MDAERLRATFRIPIEHSLGHATVFRLMQRSRHDRVTPLGEWSRSLLADSRSALLEDLYASGVPKRSASDRRKAEMVVDGVIALTEALTLGFLDGVYPDVEEVIDVLVAFSRGYFPMTRRPGTRL